MPKLSSDESPFLIAEISGNHNGSLERAHKIIDACAKSGAHAVKIQTYTADTITLNVDTPNFRISSDHPLWGGRTLYELYSEAFTPWEWHSSIFEHCRELGVVPFSSPFDETAVEFLESLDCPIYKIASLESGDIPLIKMLAPIVSTNGRHMSALLDWFGTKGKDAELLKSKYDKAVKDGYLSGGGAFNYEITKKGADYYRDNYSKMSLTESSKYDEIYGVPDRMKIIKDKGIKVGSKGKILDNIFTVDYITKNGYLVGKEDGKEAHPSNLKLTESKKSVKKIAKLTESFSKSIKGLVKFLESDGIDGLPEEVKTDEISAEETKEVTDFVEQDEAETKYVDLPSDEELGENVGLIKNEETGETYIVETEETEIPLTEAKSAKVLAKDYDFTTDIEFFDYIEDSLINGQRKQMMELFMMMDTTSRKNFYNYAKENKFKSLEEISKSKLTESDDIGKKVKFVKDFKEFDNGQTIKAGSTGTIEEFDNDIYMLNVDGKEVWIGKDDKSIKLTESSNKKIKSIRKLVESVSKNKAKKNKAIKLFESDDVNDVAKIDGVVEPIEVTDETQLVEIDGTNIELSGVDGCENGACTVLAESDDNCMMVENNETGEVYIVETEEETPIEEPKTVDEEVAVLKAKNEFLEQELSRVSNFCETASKHILRLEENASLSNRHIRRLEESQDNSLRTKTLNILLENKGLTVLKEQSEEILGKYPQLEMLKENSDSLIKFDQLGDMEKKEILEAIDMVDETELTDIINEYSSKL
jgi:hypothetical protein